MTDMPDTLPRPRALGFVNWRGLWTLIDKQIWRFLDIYLQTIIAPVVMTLLFFAVFAFGQGAAPRMPSGVSYLAFLAPGLIMMAVAQNAFINTSSSLLLSKIEGNLVDILMAPLSPFELTVGYAVGGVVRGLAVGFASIAALAFFTDMTFRAPFFVIYHMAMGSAMLSLMGVITGIWSRKFDHLVSVQSFIVLPATFLSGTFFSISGVPEMWRKACLVNPFFYMIDGFRYGFTGVAEGSLIVGMAFVFVVNLGLLGLAYHLFESGYKLKA